MLPLKVRRFKTVPGAFYGTPKEVWGFRTPAARKRPVGVARRFLSANTELLGLQGILRNLREPRCIESAAATHVILRQEHLGRRIHRAYVTVHIGRHTGIYLAKNRAVPMDHLPKQADFRLGRSRARQRALESAGSARGGRRVVGPVEELWFPKKDKLIPAYKVRVHCTRPRAEWIIYVNAVTQGILSRYDTLATATGRARLFDPNPLARVSDWRVLKDANGKAVQPPATTYVTRTLRDLDGTGRLEGKRVTTKRTASRVKRSDHQYLFDASERGFEEAMVYYHVDRAIAYVESLGYHGTRAVFREAVEVNVNGTRADNSWYSPGTRSLTFGTGGVDDAEDGETILHEFGHALEDAICPDFGQSEQAAAMGEGFGDYLAASFFAARKPKELRATVMSWDAFELSDDEPPNLRRVDSKLTFESFEAGGDEHDNGVIWSGALWDIWNALGRKKADTIIIESHFQLDGFTTMARGARAILDADRNLYAGAHLARLRKIFHARGIGPIA